MSGVGDFAALRAAIDSGADAIYLGLDEFSMRKKGFQLKDIPKIIKICHSENVKVYITLNTIIYDKELGKIEKIIEKLKGVDGVIFWDLSVLELLKKNKIKPILSTQASVSNFESAKFYYNLGIRRIVLARELDLKQIESIIKKIKKEKLDLEIECFVHGAMCVSVSGRCFTSQFLFNKSANRGECLQPCRREYTIKDEEGNELKLDNNYVMSAKDLCCASFLDKLIKIGVDAFKLEGRNRDARYVSVVTSVYRKIIDKGFEEKDLESLKKVYNRGFSEGFYFKIPNNEFSNAHGNISKERKEYVGKVTNYYKKKGVIEIKVSNLFKIKDTLIVEGHKTGVVSFTVDSISNDIKKGELVGVKGPLVRKGDSVYKIVLK